MPLYSWNQLMEESAAEGGNDFQVLPKGKYDFVIEACEATEAKSSGNPMYKATCVVESGPYAKRKVWNNFNVTYGNNKAMGILFRNLKTLGLGKEFFATEPSHEQVAAALVGKRFIGEIDHRLWNNKPQEDLKNISTPRESGMTSAVPSGVPSGLPTGPPAPAPAPAPAAPAPAPAAPAPVAAVPAAAPAPAAPAVAAVPEAAPAPVAPVAEQPAVPAAAPAPAPAQSGGLVPPPPPPIPTFPT